MHSESGYWCLKPNGSLEVVIAQSTGLAKVLKGTYSAEDNVIKLHSQVVANASKYLKKIIEEQRLGGVLAEAPGTRASVPALGDNGLESDKKTDPATLTPTSESPLQDKAAKERTSANSHSIDESFSSHHEPLTPNSGCHVDSPAGSPKGEMLKKKQRVSMARAFAKPDMVLPHQILDSSINASYQQSLLVFMGEQFNPSSRILIRNENQSGKGSGTEL
ncbi:hypothetical protein ERO13_D03G088000v2 [Gossypium hirsutum]|nr:hypothetical protein ERO13_D03G088000v2 [Gossypium hirsutum]